MFPIVIQVALGGAIGAVARYLFGVGVARFVSGASFPFAIISVNILGSFLMGLVVASALERGAGASAFLTVGVLGGFTTFAAFSLEAVTLYERGDVGAAVIYVVGSVVLSILGLALGFWIARGLAT